MPTANPYIVASGNLSFAAKHNPAKHNPGLILTQQHLPRGSPNEKEWSNGFSPLVICSCKTLHDLFDAYYILFNHLVASKILNEQNFIPLDTWFTLRRTEESFHNWQEKHQSKIVSLRSDMDNIGISRSRGNIIVTFDGAFKPWQNLRNEMEMYRKCGLENYEKTLELYCNHIYRAFEDMYEVLQFTPHDPRRDDQRDEDRDSGQYRMTRL